MSASVWVARFTIASANVQCDLCFTGCDIVQGSLSPRWRWVAEPLTTSGVDGVRMRRRHKQPVPLVLALTHPLAAQGTLPDAEGVYEDCIGEPGTLTLVVGGRTVVWRSVTVTDVQIMARGQGLIGAGAVSGSTRTLVAQWAFVRQRETE